MEHKAWIWSRKSSENTIIAKVKPGEWDEGREIDSSRCPSNLSERFAYCDCDAKEEQMQTHAKIAEQAVAGQELAETEAAFLKQELEKAWQQGEVAELRLANLEASLKNCIDEIESLRGEHEERLHSTISKAAMVSEKAQRKMEGKLTDSNKRVSNLSAENNSLMKALLCKENLIEDLDNEKVQLEVEFDTLMVRLDSAEEEIELLNENASVSENKIEMLEAELHELRKLVRNSGHLANGTRNSESWADVLLSEIEIFRKGNIKNQPECQALVTTAITPQLTENQVLQKHDSWLDGVLELILEEHRFSKRSYSELLQEIEIVLGCKGRISNKKDENCSNISGVTGLLPWKSPEKGQNTEDGSFMKLGFIERSRSDNQLDVASANNHKTLAQMIKIQSLQEENVGLKEKVEESDQTIGSLRKEVNALREKKAVIEDQMENQRLLNEDLDTQLTVAKAKLNENLHKLSSLEVELEDKSNCCEELETTCLELQLQLETISRKESPNLSIDQLAKILNTESLQNWGKQLIAMPSPDTMLLDLALCPTNTIHDTTPPVSDRKSYTVKRSSLRDKMLAENDDPRESLFSSSTKENINDEQVGPLAIVPSKKPSVGFGFIRKLFLRKKRSCSKMKTVTSLRRSDASPLIKQRDVLFVA